MTSEIFLLPPRPEKFNKIYKSKHYSEPDKVYKVNLFELTCECSDYQNRVKLYQQNDIRLICKHIVDKLKYTKLYHSYDGLLCYLIHCSAYFNDNIFIRVTLDSDEVIFIYHNSCEWVNLHTTPIKISNGYISGFAYNLIERSWQYGERPKKYKEIERYILNNIAT